MSVNPLNHYAFENLPSIHDEEALTALELAGRLGAKVNECVQAFNEHEIKTKDHLREQDEQLLGLYKVEIPKHVNDWLDDHPEATTTVLDHSLNHDKMVLGTLGFVTPQMFGAKGDGVTNDTQAIANALAFAAQNGVDVEIPGGTYIVSNVTPPSNVVIRGKGAQTVIKQIAKSGLWVNPVLINNVENVTIENLCIDGNAAEQTNDGKLGIQVLTCNNVVLRNLIVRNMLGDGISIGYTDYLSKNVLVDGCTISGSDRNELVLANCKGVTVRNCNIVGGRNFSALVDLEIHNAADVIQDVIFDGCTITRNSGEPVKLLTNGYATSFTYITFNNCIFNTPVNVAAFDNLTFRGCVVRGMELCGCHDVNVERCILSKPSSNALYVYENGSDKPENIRVVGCTVKDSNYGILISNTRYVTIQGCTIKNNTVGINVFYANHASTFDSCHIYSNGTGIKYTGETYTHNRINGCVLENTTDYEGRIDARTAIDGFYYIMSFANGTYGFKASLDSNANFVIPTTIYANMLGIRQQSNGAGWIQNGMIFEDTDGKLKYKNTNGTIAALT